jgi:hypothetical protein
LLRNAIDANAYIASQPRKLPSRGGATDQARAMASWATSSRAPQVGRQLQRVGFGGVHL